MLDTTVISIRQKETQMQRTSLLQREYIVIRISNKARDARGASRMQITKLV